MINSGVWFLKNTPRAHKLVQQWLDKQGVHGEIFGEQASLNELKEANPHLIDVVGAQVMNTPVAFHRRMLRSGEVSAGPGVTAGGGAADFSESTASRNASRLSNLS